MMSSASAIGWSGRTVTGSMIMPLSDFLTLSISSACCSIVRLRWMTPMPPSCAIAIAIADSVTVSIAALSSGMLSVDAPRQPRADVGVARQEVRRARHQQHVVEREAFRHVIA